jgi:hypothetical protein
VQAGCGWGMQGEGVSLSVGEGAALSAVDSSVTLESWIRIFKYIFDYSIIRLFNIGPFDSSIIPLLPPLEWRLDAH